MTENHNLDWLIWNLTGLEHDEENAGGDTNLAVP